ncbi:MAG: transporter substrate-binding domain-containing protein, partial [Pseudopedobacter sp.]|nr:transporter substrate-binding domain-containing protein [Deinococcales bacterium]
AAAADTLSDLAAGRIDAALNDSLILAYLTQKTRLPVQSGARVGTVIKMGIPFKKNNPKFKAALNKALTSLQKSGEYAKIGKKWFGMDVSK